MKEFWEWCGFSKIQSVGWNNLYWKAPDGWEYPSLPYPTLDNLFKYAVPGLFTRGLDLHVFSDDGYWFAYCITNDLNHKRCFDSTVGTEKVENALFWATYKALGGKS